MTQKEQQMKFLYYLFGLINKEVLTQAYKDYQKEKETEPRQWLYGFNDLGNSELFADEFREELVFVNEQKRWYIWNGRFWEQGIDKIEIKKAKELVSNLQDTCGEYDNSGRLKDHLHKLSSQRCITAMTSLAQPDMTICAGEFDADDNLLNVPNGTIKLDTGEIKKHDRKDMISKITRAEYRKEAECPRWEEFIATICGGDQEKISYLQKAIGYSITANTDEKAIFILYGEDGNNGKTTLLETIADMIGDYSSKTRAETILNKNKGTIPNEIAQLKGYHFVHTSELDNSDTLDESLVKSLVGNDSISARLLYSEYETFKPKLKLWIASNHKPKIKGLEDAIWQRIKLIELKQIPERQRKGKSRVAAMFREEYSGILNWALQGYGNYLQEGLTDPPFIKEALKTYKDENGNVEQFIGECCNTEIAEDDIQVTVSALYSAYQNYCRDEGIKYLEKQTFSKKLKKLGYENTRKDNQRFWCGIKLID